MFLNLCSLLDVLTLLLRLRRFFELENFDFG